MTEEIQCGRELMRVMMAIRKLDACLAHVPNLTPAEFNTLRCIENCQSKKLDATAKMPDPPGVRISTLSRHLRHKPPSISQMVGSLEAQGFVRRENCMSDRRAVYVALTGDGRAAMERTVGYMDRISEQIVRTFGVKEAESLTQELVRLYHSMDTVWGQIKQAKPEVEEKMQQERKGPPLW